MWYDLPVGENNDSRNNLNSNTYSRNTPLSLVVGAAGFLGSNLVDKLLEKNIQVLGVDDLSTGKRSNLEKASKQKNFHLQISATDKFNVDLPRLDYLFVIIEEKSDLSRILDIFKQYKSKLVFVSSIDLYDAKATAKLEWLKDSEKVIAKFAADHNLNARIVRLAQVYGPRMHFRQDDPAIRLIQASLKDELQKESAVLDFSSRALFVDDAIELIIKSMWFGATAQKIFDGALLSPIKVAELKQILLDPVWYENKGFELTELPPWPTPNLEKTVKYLSWRPKTNLIKGLKETTNYFKDNNVDVPELKAEEKSYHKNDLLKKEIEDWKQEAAEVEEKEEEKPKKKRGLKLSFPEFRIGEGKNIKKRARSWSASLLILALVTYALLWPVFSVGWGVLTFRTQLTRAAENLSKGEFSKSIQDLKAAEEGVGQVEFFLKTLQPIERSGLFKREFGVANQTLDLANLSLAASKHTIEGISSLYAGLKAVTGEVSSSPLEAFNKSQLELASADEQFSKAQALLSSSEYRKDLPDFFQERADRLNEKLKDYTDLVRKARAASFILPQVIAPEGKKEYLVILQNNNELRPTGGFIGSFAKMAFEGGKLKNFEVQDVYTIDGQLKLHVEPPKEIREDLNLNDWFLRDANWEPDFPTSARQIEWFYNQETGERVEGVIALDVSAVENLLNVVGELNLADYRETITSENLFSKSITYAESNFFPGSQAKKSFLSALSNQLFNKLFFLPNQNWPGVVQALGKSMAEKHLMVYLDNPTLFSYLVSQNWAGVLPRAAEEKEGIYNDFLFPVEANLGVNKANYFLERSYLLDTVIGKEGEISHRLRIKYINRSPSDTFPAGKYKNRFRIYLPLGAKLNRALWGEANITQDFSAFVDYGRTGYSTSLHIEPKEEKTLVLDYQVPRKLTFKDGKGEYQLNLIKQPGTLKDSFEWKLSYPINYSLTSQKSGEIAPQELVISTNLSSDKVLKAEFSK